MRVGAIMSRPVVTVGPETTLQSAAALMRHHDIGALAVVDHGRPVGMVTDRDMVTLALAEPGDAGSRAVAAAMSPEPISCKDSQTITEAVAVMGDRQTERLLVLDAQDRLVGIISVGDIAVNASEVLAGQAIGEICEDRRTSERSPRIKPRE